MTVDATTPANTMETTPDAFGALCDMTGWYATHIGKSKENKQSLKELRKLAVTLSDIITTEVNDIYKNGPVVHGTRQSLRLDLLDKWRIQAYAVCDLCDNRIALYKHHEPNH